MHNTGMNSIDEETNILQGSVTQMKKVGNYKKEEAAKWKVKYLWAKREEQNSQKLDKGKEKCMKEKKASYDITPLTWGSRFLWLCLCDHHAWYAEQSQDFPGPKPWLNQNSSASHTFHSP